MRILICEDDDVALKVIQVALAGENADIVYVKDGRAALDLIKANNDFGLIVTDIHMPYHNGDELLHLVRIEQKKNTPFVMISSDSDEEVVALALRSGVNEFIAKPLDAKTLAKRLKKFL